MVVKFIISLFLVFCMTAQPVDAVVNRLPSDPYLAVIADPSLYWMYGKVPKDFIYMAEDWDNFPEILRAIKKSSNGKKIVLNLMVHGENDGLYFQWITQREYNEGSKNYHTDRASFGYVINNIERILGNDVVVFVEACYSGRAYKNTIRNCKRYSPYDNVEDYNKIPIFPIYGIGSAAANAGPLSLLQYNGDISIPEDNLFEDLRVYDLYTPNSKTLDPYEDTSEEKPGRKFSILKKHFDKFVLKNKYNML